MGTGSAAGTGSRNLASCSLAEEEMVDSVLLLMLLLPPLLLLLPPSLSLSLLLRGLWRWSLLLLPLLVAALCPCP